MAFPDAGPDDIGQEHTEGNVTWKWDGEKWQKQFKVDANPTTSLVDIEGELDEVLNDHTRSIIPDYASVETQKDTNKWTALSLKVFDEKYDVDGNFIGGVIVDADEPQNPKDGMLWYKNEPQDEVGLYVFDGVAFQPANDHDHVPAVILRETTPLASEYQEGTIWVDETTYNSYVSAEHDDGEMRWVQLNSDVTPPPAPLTMSDNPPDPANTDDGQLWVNTNNMDLFVLYEGAWIKLNASLA